MKGTVTSLALAIIFISGCKTKLLVPASFEIARPADIVLEVQNQDVSLLLEFVAEEDKLEIFDLEVLNQSENNLSFDPAQVTLWASNTKFPAPDMANPINQARIHAGYDMKFSLLPTAVGEHYKKLIRSRERAQMIAGLLSIALVVNDAAQASKNNWNVMSERDINRDQARQVATFAGVLGLDIIGEAMWASNNVTMDDLYYLEEEILPVTELQAGQRARGKVYFKDFGKFSYYRMLVPINKVYYIFDLKRASQTELKAWRSSTLN